MSAKKIQKPLRYEAIVRQYCLDKDCPFDRETRMSFSNQKDAGDTFQKLYSAHYVDEKNREHDDTKHPIGYMEIVRRVIICEVKK